MVKLQINPEKAREDFRDVAKQNGGSTGVKDFMDGMGLGMIVDQVKLIEMSGYVFHPTVYFMLSNVKVDESFKIISFLSELIVFLYASNLTSYRHIRSYHSKIIDCIDIFEM